MPITTSGGSCWCGIRSHARFDERDEQGVMAMPLQSLVDFRRKEIARQLGMCRSCVTAAETAERGGMTERAHQLRVYALLHWLLMEQEQMLLDVMIETEVPAAFEQAGLFGERHAA